MTFVRQCEDTLPHPVHQYRHTWYKANLQHLRDPHRYPSEWSVLYLCHGVTGEEDPTILRCLRVYAEHEWFPTPRLCACGAFFEASTEGHKLHSEHRMAAVLLAYDPTPENWMDL